VPTGFTRFSILLPVPGDMPQSALEFFSNRAAIGALVKNQSLRYPSSRSFFK
jgi:hypothetical protein